jgi:P27 family predicted phage terminase small subunit
MGRPGPKPRRRNLTPPSEWEGEPEPPDDLDATAREAWDYLTGLLRSTGILCRADRDALVLYTMTFSRWRRAEADLDRVGTVIVDKYGQAKANPAATVAKDARATLIRLLGEFGLTPHARAGVIPSRTTAHGPPNGNSSGRDDRWKGLLNIGT